MNTLDEVRKTLQHDTIFFEELNRLIEKYGNDLPYEFKVELLDIMKKPGEEKQYEFESPSV